MKLRNKLIATISTVALVLSAFTSMSFATAGDSLNISATSAPVKAGEKAVLEVALDKNTVDGIIALTFNLTFDEKFNVPAVADTAGCALLTGASAVNTSVVLNTNKYKFDWSDNLGDTPVSATGKLFTLGVEVPEGTPAGKYPVTVDLEYVADAEWNEDLTLSFTTDAFITVEGGEEENVETRYYEATVAANRATGYWFDITDVTANLKPVSEPTVYSFGSEIAAAEGVTVGLAIDNVPVDNVLSVIAHLETVK